MRSASASGRRSCRVPALWETQGPAVIDRLVRAVLAARSAAESRCCLCRLRTGHPTVRRGALPFLLGTLTAPDPGARVERRCGAGRSTHMVGRLRRLPRRTPPSQPRLQDAHQAGKAVGGHNYSRASADTAGVDSCRRAAGPGSGRLPHREQAGAGAGPRRTPRRPAPATSCPCGARTATAGDGRVRRAPDRRSRSRPPRWHPPAGTPRSRPDSPRCGISRSS